METHEHEKEFERRLFELLRTYSHYLVTKRKLQALNEDPGEYMTSGTLLVPNSEASQEHAGLLAARDNLFSSLSEQAVTIGEPLTGVLPDLKRHDLTFDAQTIKEIVSSMCEFLRAF